jgi:CRISPR/Cas system endoribonuclease Cas6 (RAMP superfamily)
MPTALIMEAVPGRDRWWDRPPALRALGYQLLSCGDPEFARAVHPEADLAGGAEAERPFTIAVLPDAARLRVRLTALTDPATAALTQAAEALPPGAAVAIGGTRIEVAGWEAGEAASYALLAQAPFAHRVEMEFVSPTTFSSSGRFLPLPVPERLFQSWVRRWNAFAPEPLFLPAEVLAEVAVGLGLASHAVESRAVDLQPGHAVGFVGRVGLVALRRDRWSAPARGALAALCAYAPYCGTGARTAEGLGLTRRLPAGPERRGRAPEPDPPCAPPA